MTEVTVLLSDFRDEDGHLNVCSPNQVLMGAHEEHIAFGQEDDNRGHAAAGLVIVALRKLINSTGFQHMHCAPDNVTNIAYKRPSVVAASADLVTDVHSAISRFVLANNVVLPDVVKFDFKGETVFALAKKDTLYLNALRASHSSLCLLPTNLTHTKNADKACLVLDNCVQDVARQSACVQNLPAPPPPAIKTVPYIVGSGQYMASNKYCVMVGVNCPLASGGNSRGSGGGTSCVIL